MDSYPLIKVSAHAGFIRDYHLEDLDSNYDWFRIPGFNPTLNQRLFEVEGNSMAPTILDGDLVICQTQKKIENVLDGTVVLVVTKEAILIKRFRAGHDPGYLLLENDNEKEQSQLKISRKDVLEIMSVRGKVTGVLVPHHEIASKGKISALEEALELLKKEVFKLNKKIASMSS
ncbi:helix-turn-helix transcriptional regulator [Zunongwangia sp. H14]|uniref:S24 family peptidase n=1 Tax=Zunongwangia sp. H14 TaxID=3240792 RepID=UPI003564E8CF